MQWQNPTSPADFLSPGKPADLPERVPAERLSGAIANRMEQSLKHRLKFGSLMLAALLALLWIDAEAQAFTRALGWNHLPGPAGTVGQPVGIGGIGLLIVLLILLPPATVELATLFAAEKVKPYRFIAGLGSGLLVLHAFCTQFRKFQVYSTSALAFVIVFTMMLTALRRAAMKQTQEAITHMAGTLLATMYLGGLAWFLMALRVKESNHPGRFSGSTLIIVMILLVVKSTDIGAYFGGKAIGKHKLIFWLSPGKTWEGLICGLLTAGLVGAIFAPFINPPQYHLPWWKGLIFGILIGFVGQLGDLLESLMKRDANVKDSSHLIPGFGGILDIIDSPLVAAPFAYLLFSLF
jgi:phosphatidate cytidylyltransferase